MGICAASLDLILEVFERWSPIENRKDALVGFYACLEDLSRRNPVRLPASVPYVLQTVLDSTRPIDVRIRAMRALAGQGGANDAHKILPLIDDEDERLAVQALRTVHALKPNALALQGALEKRSKAVQEEIAHLNFERLTIRSPTLMRDFVIENFNVFMRRKTPGVFEWLCLQTLDDAHLRDLGALVEIETIGRIAWHSILSIAEFRYSTTKTLISQLVFAQCRSPLFCPTADVTLMQDPSLTTERMLLIAAFGLREQAEEVRTQARSSEGGMDETLATLLALGIVGDERDLSLLQAFKEDAFAHVALMSRSLLGDSTVDPKTLVVKTRETLWALHLLVKRGAVTRNQALKIADAAPANNDPVFEHMVAKFRC